MKRRNFFKSLAIGAAGVSLGGLRPFEVHGQTTEAPKRFILFTTAHGPTRQTWHMSPPGLGAGDGSASLASLDPSDFSRVYEPLHRVREHVSILEGLSMMSAMIDRNGPDNNHGVSWSNLLVNEPYNSDDPFVGTVSDNLHPRPGGASIDYHIGQNTGGGARLDAAFWGGGYGRFGSRFAFSSNELGQWIVPNDDPSNAFERLMSTGLLVPDMGPTEPEPEPMVTREQLIRQARFRAYNVAASQFDRIAPGLSSVDQASLVAHRNHLTRLGMRFQPGGGGGPGMGPATMAMCTPEFTASGDTTDDFFRLATIALACDAVRVISIDAPELRGSVIGGSDADDVHQLYAHGTDDRARMMMENYYRYHAEEFANLVEYLRSVPEGDGTLLDNTLVMWVSELSSGGHEFDDVPTVLAGGGASGFSPGRYIRFPRDIPNVGCGYGCEDDMVGPGRVHLFINAMQHMGMSDDSFGRRSATSAGGGTIDLTGPLSEVS